MRITHLNITDFRSYHQWENEPDPSLTVFVGPNAIGKTNIIEAIQLIATGTSFRRPRWSDLVRWGAERATLAMVAEGEGSHAEVKLTISGDGSRTWTVGGGTKTRASDAARFVPVVAFTPDDLLLVKGPAEQRRWAIDSLGEQLSATYGALRRDYMRVVRQRNALLRDGGSDGDLKPWDQQLTKLGSRLHTHRSRLARRVAEAASPVYSHLAPGEQLELKVSAKCGLLEVGAAGPSLEAAEEALAEEIERRRADERSRKISLVGPHRDDIIFNISGRDARAYASQGQQRTIALAWKWAEVAIVTEVLKRAPVLLLDDVMSELDESRRRALTDLMQRDTQTFITTTTTDYFEPGLLRAARVVPLGG